MQAKLVIHEKEKPSEYETFVFFIHETGVFRQNFFSQSRTIPWMKID